MIHLHNGQLEVRDWNVRWLRKAEVEYTGENINGNMGCSTVQSFTVFIVKMHK